MVSELFSENIINVDKRKIYLFAVDEGNYEIPQEELVDFVTGTIPEIKADEIIFSLEEVLLGYVLIDKRPYNFSPSKFFQDYEKRLLLLPDANTAIDSHIDISTNQPIKAPKNALKARNDLDKLREIREQGRNVPDHVEGDWKPYSAVLYKMQTGAEFLKKSQRFLREGLFKKDFFGTINPKYDYNIIPYVLNLIVEGNFPIFQGIDEKITKGTRLIISKRKGDSRTPLFRKPIGSDDLFSIISNSWHDVWVYNITKWDDEAPWRMELDVSRQTNEADKLDLYQTLKQAFRTTDEQIVVGSNGLSFEEAMNYLYEGQYIAKEELFDLSEKVLNIQGIKIEDVNDKSSAIQETKSLYDKMIQMAVDRTGYASDLLKNAGQCMRAVYHLGEKELPVEIQEIKVKETEFDGIEDQYFFNFRHKEYKLVNLSEQDIERLNPKSILFIQLEKIPGYDKMFDGSVEHKAYVVDLKF